MKGEAGQVMRLASHPISHVLDAESGAVQLLGNIRVSTHNTTETAVMATPPAMRAPAVHSAINQEAYGHQHWA
ncbi:hypothetical protein GOP47_0016273 [Adiantum capillus-veneris]|uniref:Uncharacterized protein n=1 Tax=Adiantum capillus-veneris TaxID=13818 RepID=A0A9D4ZA50_ADICA|nr:hypothetical protein GOP47_0016273 [Adiantum capillus-veneris]